MERNLNLREKIRKFWYTSRGFPLFFFFLNFFLIFFHALLLPKIQTGRFGLMESALGVFSLGAIILSCNILFIIVAYSCRSSSLWSS